MHDELVKRLRIAAQLADKGLVIMPSICLEAADAIEQLSNAGSAYGRGWTLGYDAGREESKPRWIPVTERLPEVRTWVLCYCRANSFDVFRMTDEGHWQYGNRSIYMKGYVTHWMPLPELPKEDEN